MALSREARDRAEFEAFQGTRLGPPNALKNPYDPRLRASQADLELAELRRQQAAFREVVRDIGRDNRWMAAPVLAPVAIAAGGELAAALAARRLAAATAAAVAAGRKPLVLKQKDPYLRVGDNWATRAGRRAHAQLEARLKQKPGWDYEVRQEGGLKPDVSAPARRPEELKRRHQMELKPDTPTGRKAAARAVKRYEAVTKNKTRAIYYNPKDYM